MPLHDASRVIASVVWFRWARGLAFQACAQVLGTGRYLLRREVFARTVPHRPGNGQGPLFLPGRRRSNLLADGVGPDATDGPSYAEVVPRLTSTAMRVAGEVEGAGLAEPGILVGVSGDDGLRHIEVGR